MVCPKCLSNFPWYVTVCAHCDVDLWDHLPDPKACPKCYHEFPWPKAVCPRCHVRLRKHVTGPPPDPDIQLVPVFATCDLGALEIAKSVLEEEGIEYSVPSENLQDLIGAGRVGGCNIVLGPVHVLVREEDEDRARKLLEQLTLQTS